MKSLVLFSLAITLAGCAAATEHPMHAKHEKVASLLGDPCELDSDCCDDALICRFQTCSPAEQGHQ